MTCRWQAGIPTCGHYAILCIAYMFSTAGLVKLVFSELNSTWLNTFRVSKADVTDHRVGTTDTDK